MPKSIANELIEATKKLGQTTIRWVDKFSPTRIVLLLISAFTLLVAGYHYVFVAKAKSKQIVFLSAPSGAQGYDLAVNLSSALTSPASWNLREPRLQLLPQPTDGYEDNRSRIQNDRSGSKIGFAQDGFNATNEVKVLLPLDYTYLHVVISKTLYDCVLSQKNASLNVLDMTVVGKFRMQITCPGTGESDGTSAEPPRLFKDIVPLLKLAGSDGHPPSASLSSNRPPSHLAGAANPDDRQQGYGSDLVHRKVSLGMPLSGTRQVANIVLSHYGVDASKLDFGTKYDWTETISALEKEEIHLAFFLTEPGLEAFQKLAATGRFYMLGFDDTEGLASTHPYIHPVRIPRSMYGYPKTGELRSCFCSADTWTMATRRVIVAPSCMDERTAFFLASQLNRGFDSMTKPISWKLPPGPNGRSDGGLYYSVHPGAKYLEQNLKPWYESIPPVVQSTGIGVITFTCLGLVVGALGWLTRLLADTADAKSPPESTTKSPTVPPSAAATVVFQTLLVEIEQAIEQFIEQVETRRSAYWKNLHRKLNRKCCEATNKYQMNEDQQKDLSDALGALNWKIHLRSPATTPGASTKKRRR